MNIVKTVSLVMAAVAVAASFPATAADTSGAKIGISWSYINNTFYQAESSLVTEGLKQQGLIPLPVANANGDLSKQLSDMETLIAQGVKALVVVPIDSKAVGPVVDRAAQRGIPMVGPDIGIDDKQVFVNVTTDNYLMGEMECESLGPLVKKGNVAYITGNLADLAGRNRHDGFMDCMKKKFPNTKVVVGESKWDTRVAADQLQALLIAHPDIKGVSLASDCQYLTAILQVLRTNGRLKPAGDPAHVFLATIDGGPEAMNAIRAGQVDITIAQNLLGYAKYTSMYVKSALEGKRVSIGKTDHGSEVVSRNGVLYDMIPAILVSKNNVNDPQIWGNVIQRK
ncbi:sugar ABC transporter substrate-binding protein [Burkholderia sp. SCN-KJ]|uniref:sugar ABC transporter substrate-binding protein n=1 Tax=Burkholderia sp. SCN-KJ TaxID=2969248 RepID=UPI00214FD5D2|nr:sugar ABC transporter substrate-binding protein [Burkholderia sp. SCN-KJ]MCR4471590.1 sugar ABC transporter substrate-binding protein [Burkholderia sp. SCN-KJ]